MAHELVFKTNKLTRDPDKYNGERVNLPEDTSILSVYAPNTRAANRRSRNSHHSITLLNMCVFIQLRRTMSWNTNKTQQDEKNQNHSEYVLQSQWNQTRNQKHKHNKKSLQTLAT